MNIVSVIPIARGIAKEELTYFSKNELSLGTVVLVPLRSRTIPAVVVESKPLLSVKADIKNASFALKKIVEVRGELFHPGFISACVDIARFFGTTTGSVLFALSFIESFSGTKKESPLSHSPRKVKREPSVIQMPDKDRFAFYRNAVREELARGKSVLLIVPEREEGETLLSEIGRGINDHSYFIHGSLPRKKLQMLWDRARTDTSPSLIIGTGSALSLPRNDLGMIIIERESARGYKMMLRPYLDIRKAAEVLAEKLDVKILFGDVALRAETLWRKEQGQVVEAVPTKSRILSPAEIEIIDMKKEEKKERFMLSERVLSLLKDGIASSERFFLLVGRRGLSPITRCGDCGNLLRCSRCTSPLVLHGGDAMLVSGNIHVCHVCGDTTKAKDKCPACGSWKLGLLGIGAAHVEKELTEHFPKIKLFRLDRDTAPTHKKAEVIAEKFLTSPGSVLIGTEMALAYIQKEVENIIVVSADSLLSIPDFRMRERLFSLLIRLRERAEKRFIIQTRSDDSVFLYASKGNILDFYREEISDRRKLKFPPFTTLIKIVIQGKKEPVLSLVESLGKEFEEWDPTVYPSFSSSPRGMFRINILLSANPYPDDTLIQKLQALPPNILVKVDPEDVL